MKKIELVKIYSEDFQKEVTMVSVDGEVFDWGIDPNALVQAKVTISNHNELSESIVLSMIDHFLECFSEFIGRDINLEEFNNAVREGKL
jgi:hypothetical protein